MVIDRQALFAAKMVANLSKLTGLAYVQAVQQLHPDTQALIRRGVAIMQLQKMGKVNG